MDKENQKIMDVLLSKAVLKQDVYDNVKKCYDLFKSEIRSCSEALAESVKEDNRLHIEYHDKTEFESQVKVAGDVLLFQMHTNVFLFDKAASLWKTSYVKEDETRAFVGVINIYNFLADSIKYHRLNDVGYLIARIFINKDNHFFVQGKKQLGLLFNDFVNAKLDEEHVKQVVSTAIQYTLDFDLYVPPYDHVQHATVGQISQANIGLGTTTGKRLGFKFQFED